MQGSITEDPNRKNGGILYGVDIQEGRTYFIRKLPDVLRFAWEEGVTQWDYVKGVDGNIYTYLGNVLVRIHPGNMLVEPIGRLRRLGRMCFVGPDLYLAGDEPIRRLKNIAGR